MVGFAEASLFSISAAPVGDAPVVSTVTELRQEVSCFTPPQQGELYLSCKTFGVISIVRARLGSRRINNVTSSLAECDVSTVSVAPNQHNSNNLKLVISFYTMGGRQGQINLSRQSMHCFGGTCTIFFHRKIWWAFLVVVISIHFSHTSMTNFSLTIFTTAWWWGLQYGGASCARANCAHWIIRPWC